MLAREKHTLCTSNSNYKNICSSLYCFESYILLHHRHSEKQFRNLYCLFTQTFCREVSWPIRMPWVRWKTCSHTTLAVTEELNIYCSGTCRGYRERGDSLHENLFVSVASACKAKQIKRTSTGPNPKHHNSDDIPTTCCEKPMSVRNNQL